MTKEIEILTLQSRIKVIENRKTAEKSPGVLRKLKRRLAKLTSET